MGAYDCDCYNDLIGRIMENNIQNEHRNRSSKEINKRTTIKDPFRGLTSEQIDIDYLKGEYYHLKERIEYLQSDNFIKRIIAQLGDYWTLDYNETKELLAAAKDFIKSNNLAGEFNQFCNERFQKKLKVNNLMIFTEEYEEYPFVKDKTKQ